jgi:hypothetical protein
MMGRRIPMVSGDEFDALTKARRVYCYLQRAGAAARIKRQYRRRERRERRSENRGVAPRHEDEL